MNSGSGEKISFKYAELSAKKFNNEAVPHHIGLLKNHKSNIEKLLALGDWTKIQKEEINALRIIKQLKNFLLEMDSLRSNIKDEDVHKFDEIISIGRLKTIDAIKDYMSLQLKSPTSTIGSTQSTPYGNSPTEVFDNLPQIQIDFKAEEHQLLAKQACLEEFENLQREISDLNIIFKDLNSLVHEQSEPINIITENAEEALDNVIEGENQLRHALKYKKALYPVFGAVLGTCVGGPIGLIAGLKAGGLAAVGCGILGFTGGTVLKSDIRNGVEEEKED